VRLENLMVYNLLQQMLDKRKKMGNLRELKTVSHLIDLTSNDYLGFARSKNLKRDIFNECQLIDESYPTFGSTGSRLLTGNHPYCEKLEETIAKFHGAEKGLIFNTGYMANLGLVSSLALSKDVTFLFDTHIHASMRDGIRKNNALNLPFRHQDANHLEERLKKTKGTTFVCAESLYSIDGTIAPLKEFGNLCEKYGANLIVDEAHATGIIGEKGEGLVSHLGMQNQVFARVHTFGKAVGVHGAIVLGKKLLIDYLINFSLPFIYTTSLPLHCLAAIKSSYEKFPMAHEERAHLRFLKETFFKSSARESPIIPLPIDGNERAKALSLELSLNGFDVRPILSPTVQQGSECLRLCLHAFNTADEIKSLMDYVITKTQVPCKK
jgi:8-amino-7-oxononanoate synthase